MSRLPTRTGRLRPSLTTVGFRLNSASAAELETIPGVGPVLAGRIIDARDEIGGFTAVEDLLDVSGIGEATLASMRDYVVVP